MSKLITSKPARTGNARFQKRYAVKFPVIVILFTPRLQPSVLANRELDAGEILRYVEHTTPHTDMTVQVIMETGRAIAWSNDEGGVVMVNHPRMTAEERALYDALTSALAEEARR